MTQVEIDIADIKRSIALIEQSVAGFTEEIKNRPSLPVISLEIQKSISEQVTKCDNNMGARDRKWVVGLISTSISTSVLALFAIIRSL